VARQQVITVSRAGEGWRAEIPSLGRLLRARWLYSLFVQLRTMVDLQTATVQFRTGDNELDALVRDLRAAQRRAEAATRQVHALTGELLARSQGWTNRDVAALIGKSHQRVAQLRQERAAPGCLNHRLHPA
jgi:hypothetical protein